LRFVWNEDQNRTNLAKHGISFATAARVFDDRRALSSPDGVVEGEERWKTIGWAAGIGRAHGGRRRRRGSHSHHFGAKGDGKGEERL
jgi:uncharacterized DUF497 family protein